MKSWRTCHECRPKKWSAPNLRKPLTLASAGENNRSIASPANLCPAGDRRTLGRSVNLRTLSLGRLPDTIFGPFFPCLHAEQSHDAETLWRVTCFLLSCGRKGMRSDEHTC